MRDRICYLCKNPLYYEDYVARNIGLEEFLVYTEISVKGRICKIVFSKPFKKHELVKLWQSIQVQLACCHCRRFLDELVSCKPATWELLTWANDERLITLRELGIINQDQLVKLKEKK